MYNKTTLTKELKTMTIGENIKNLRIKHGLDQVTFGEIAGVSDKAVSSWENNNSVPRMGAIEKIASYFHIKKSDIIEGESHNIEFPSNILPISRQKIPLLGNIACGSPIEAAEEFDMYIEANSNIDADFCLRCKGDSMIGARIYDGDIVFIRKQDMVDNGEIAAVIIDNEATLKRVQYFPDENILILKAENPKYADLIYSGEKLNHIRILGKAISFYSEL